MSYNRILPSHFNEWSADAVNWLGLHNDNMRLVDNIMTPSFDWFDWTGDTILPGDIAWITYDTNRDRFFAAAYGWNILGIVIAVDKDRALIQTFGEVLVRKSDESVLYNPGETVFVDSANWIRAKAFAPGTPPDVPENYYVGSVIEDRGKFAKIILGQYVQETLKHGKWCFQRDDARPNYPLPAHMIYNGYSEINDGCCFAFAELHVTNGNISVNTNTMFNGHCGFTTTDVGELSLVTTANEINLEISENVKIAVPYLNYLTKYDMLHEDIPHLAVKTPSLDKISILNVTGTWAATNNINFQVIVSIITDGA